MAPPGWLGGNGGVRMIQAGFFQGGGEWRMVKEAHVQAIGPNTGNTASTDLHHGVVQYMFSRVHCLPDLQESGFG